jgi:hypothetical protein
MQGFRNSFFWSQSEEMGSVALLLLVLCCGLLSFVEAFAPNRFLRKLSTPYEQSSRTCSRRMQQSTISQAVVSNAEEMAAAVVAQHPLAKRAFERLLDVLPVATIFGPVYGIYGNYVSRPAIEERILQAYNSCLGSGDGVYTVVVGPEGSGKSSATAHALEHKPGVVYMHMDRADTPSSVLRNILRRSGEQIDRGLVRVPLRRRTRGQSVNFTGYGRFCASSFFDDSSP